MRTMNKEHAYVIAFDYTTSPVMMLIDLLIKFFGLLALSKALPLVQIWIWMNPTN